MPLSQVDTMSPYMDFKLKRDSIVGQKHLDVMNGVSFTDAKLVARSSARKFKELAVAVDILNAASEGSTFEKYVSEYCDASASCPDDGYDEDSDLELDEDDDEPVVLDETKSQSIAPKIENNHNDVFDTRVTTPKVSASTPAAVDEECPASSDDGFSDVNVAFSDISSQASCLSRDDYEEAIVTPSPKRSPSLHNPKPRSIGLALDDHVKITVPGAHKTCKALYFFLLTDHLKFAPLRSNLFASTNQEAESKYKDLPSCSPKSMYRLANRFGFVEAKRLALSKFKSCLDEDNIVQELFSDFTWRYPEVLEAALVSYKKYRGHPKVESTLETFFALVIELNKTQLTRVVVGIHKTLVDEFKPHKTVSEQPQLVGSSIAFWSSAPVHPPVSAPWPMHTCTGSSPVPAPSTSPIRTPSLLPPPSLFPTRGTPPPMQAPLPMSAASPLTTAGSLFNSHPPLEAARSSVWGFSNLGQIPPYSSGQLEGDNEIKRQEEIARTPPTKGRKKKGKLN